MKIAEANKRNKLTYEHQENQRLNYSSRTASGNTPLQSPIWMWKEIEKVTIAIPNDTSETKRHFFYLRRMDTSTATMGC